MLVAGALGVAAAASTPGAAWAHGISGAAADMSVWEFVPLGIEHMLLGWDHLLFIAGIVLLAANLRRAAKLISVFVLGHSTTLIIATLAGWQVNATAVDVVIAMSLVFVGLVGWFGHRDKWRLFGLGVLAFGLIHGVGLSTRLQDLGLPEDGLLVRVIAFNVGIEIGQLLGIVAMVLVGKAFARLTWPAARRYAFATLAVVGVLAAGVLAVLEMTGANAPATTAVGTCTVGPRTERFSGTGGGHPDKDFFEPGEATPDNDFGHVVGDGYVIVQYSPSLPAAQLDQLRTYVTSPEGTRIVGGPAPSDDQELKAIHAFQTLTCTTFDLAALQRFSTGWFNDPRSQ
ncbi:HupE/UreJ family protein [Micromonospora foliorum]|uniref:HupE/UreJ family protein n=1 Tax=Micromonospora foliorum TaxID=2911210 RepID=UPI001EE86841|nr:HupE/UreJ family protein [Micromonospora foliorum]MCG5436436.1 HupE/UreJ family protein [Micromonospora foliorum]